MDALLHCHRIRLIDRKEGDIDIAFLPVNQPYTMTVEQCVHAAQVIRPKVLIPYHFSRTDLSELPALLPDMQVLLRQMQ